MGGADPLEIYFKLLGPLEVWAGGRQLQLGGPKQRALLAILLLQANHVVSRQRLIELLWGDHTPETAENNLQVLISQLRKVLEPLRASQGGEPVIATRPPGYELRAERDHVDLGRFRHLADEARLARSKADWQSAATHLRQALNLWRGPALADLETETFATGERGQLEEVRLQALEDRIEADLMLGAHSNLIAELEGVVAEHPLRERLRGQLMLALYRSGRQAESSAVYQETRELLVDQLGMEPGSELQQLLKRILNQDPLLDIKAATMAIRRESRLPQTRDVFVDRKLEMEQLGGRLQTSSLVTLTGPGGIGKTRLALELSAKLSEHYADGVVFVDFAPLTDQSLIPRTIAWALGLRDDGIRDPMDVIVAHLYARSLMLILDNCEHVLSTAAQVAAEVLSQCRGLTILATSREALRVHGETVWEVPPLPHRSNGSGVTAADSDQGDAVALFRARAESAAPKSFIWDGASSVDATRVCYRLDGNPLAIELAAARLRVMPLSELVSGLDDRFALLTTGTRTGTPRHYSLEATVEWSFQLLSPPERSLFQRLAVFAGGFTAGAAEEVCADDELPRDEIRPTLFSLVEKSLIRFGVAVDGSARYSMLGTIREFIRAKLRASDGDLDVHRRHAAHFSAVATSTEAELKSARQVQRLAQLEEEHANFRTAIEWALEHEPTLALEIAVKLGEFWLRRHIGEGTMWVNRALENAAQTVQLRARGVALAGQLAWLVGDQDAALALLDEAIEQWSALGDVPRAAHAADLRAAVQFESGERETALNNLIGVVELLRSTNDRWSLALALDNLGWFQHQAGDSSRGKQILDEALELARQAGDPWLVAIVLDSIASAEMAIGEHDGARAHWRDCCQIAIALDNPWLTAWILEGRARLALVENDPRLCIRLVSASDAARDSIGAVAPEFWREILAATLDEARRKLTDSDADSAWREGRAMTAQQILTSVAST
jgi:predicted ATPase/DNA-binding SARP family transcriptional activator